MQLHYHGYLNQTGYSIAAQDYILAIKKILPDLSIKFHIQNKHSLGISPNRLQYFMSLTNTKDAPESEQIHVYHATPVRFRKHQNAKKSIGVCLFETISPPKHWIEQCNIMDEIIVASEFNKNVFETAGVRVPISVVQHCFDTNLFNNNVEHNGRYSMTTFVSIGTFKKRKNWDGLIKGFYSSFSKKDNVCLLLKTDKPHLLENTIQTIKRTSEWRSKDTGPIYLDRSNVLSFEEIPVFMKKGDIYVCPSLGEGFGLPGMHSMALGMPLVTTKYSGVLEYAKEGLCTYIEPSGFKTQPVMDGIPQFSNGIWPILKNESIGKAMKEAMDFKNEKKAYEYVHNNFNYNVIGEKFIKVISQ